LVQGFPFAHEAGDDIGVAGHNSRVEGFDGDGFPCLGIGRPVNIAHAAPAEQVFFRVADFEMIGNELACAHDNISLSNTSAATNAAPISMKIGEASQCAVAHLTS